MNDWALNTGPMHWESEGWLVMILLIAVFIVGIVFLIRWAINYPAKEKHENDAKNKPTALQILDERYAKGDIPRDEYIQMKKDLENRG